MTDVAIGADRIQVGPRFAVSFHRTLRIPDDGRDYPLPPGLGTFPIRKVADFLDRVPDAWRRTGGAFIAMYQREALWLGFHGAAWKPNAVKVAIGGVNALTGEPDGAELRGDPQNYLVAPLQPWLDGIKTGAGSVRQFVAMPLGLGYTVEAALTGDERRGGLQLTVFEPRPGRFPDAPPPAPTPIAGTDAQLLFRHGDRRGRRDAAEGLSGPSRRRRLGSGVARHRARAHRRQPPLPARSPARIRRPRRSTPPPTPRAACRGSSCTTRGGGISNRRSAWPAPPPSRPTTRSGAARTPEAGPWTSLPRK